MSSFITILFAGIFTDNIVTSKLLGLDQLSEQNNSVINLLKKCGLLTVLLFMSSVITYPIIQWVLIPVKAEYLSPFISVIIICGILAAAFIATKHFAPTTYTLLNDNKSVLTCSSLVLGLCLINFNSDLIANYLDAVVFALAAGLGFTFASLIFYGIRQRLDTTDLPDTVKGLPITLIIAALISLAFGGFSGI